MPIVPIRKSELSELLQLYICGYHRVLSRHLPHIQPLQITLPPHMHFDGTDGALWSNLLKLNENLVSNIISLHNLIEQNSPTNAFSLLRDIADSQANFSREIKSAAEEWRDSGIENLLEIDRELEEVQNQSAGCTPDAESICQLALYVLTGLSLRSFWDARLHQRSAELSVLENELQPPYQINSTLNIVLEAKTSSRKVTYSIARWLESICFLSALNPRHLQAIKLETMLEHFRQGAAKIDFSDPERGGRYLYAYLWEQATPADWDRYLAWLSTCYIFLPGDSPYIAKLLNAFPPAFLSPRSENDYLEVSDAADACTIPELTTWYHTNLSYYYTITLMNYAARFRLNQHLQCTNEDLINWYAAQSQPQHILIMNMSNCPEIKPETHPVPPPATNNIL